MSLVSIGEDANIIFSRCLESDCCLLVRRIYQGSSYNFILDLSVIVFFREKSFSRGEFI